MTLVVSAVALGCGLGGRPPITELNLEPRQLPLLDGHHYSLSWLDDGVLAIASGVGMRDSRLDLINSANPEASRSVPVPDPDCLLHTIGALGRLPDGRLAFANICEGATGLRSRRATIHAYDAVRMTFSDLGATADAPAQMAWTNDMATLYYQAGTSLCETIYVRDASGDGPLGLTVVIENNEIPIGEDVVHSRDRCTSLGNAFSPTMNTTTGELAAFVSPTIGANGQARIDRPASIVIVAGGDAGAILDGIYYFGGLAWIDSERLVFSGQYAGVEGMWTVRSDGSEITLASRQALAPFAVNPSGTELAGLEVFPTEDGTMSRVFLLDLTQ